MLGGLSLYAAVFDKNGEVPLFMILVTGLAMGFLQPKGGWRWVILIGVGVHLAQISGNLIASSPIPSEYQLTFQKVFRDVPPALIGTYIGIFLRRYFFDPDSYSADRALTVEEKLVANFDERIIEKELAVNKTAITTPDNVVSAFESTSVQQVAQAVPNPEITRLVMPSQPVSQPIPAPLVAKQAVPLQPLKRKVTEPTEVPDEKDEQARRLESLKRLESQLGLK